LAGEDARRDVPDWNITGGLYAPFLMEDIFLRGAADSPLQFLMEWARDRVSTFMTNRATRDLPSDLRVQDDLEILDVHEAPMCEACGWSGSDLRKCESARLIPPRNAS
jgi:hypothetical protein